MKKLLKPLGCHEQRKLEAFILAFSCSFKLYVVLSVEFLKFLYNLIIRKIYPLSSCFISFFFLWTYIDLGFWYSGE